ncbi:hypothetical protein ACLQ3K_06710 [Tsukamurella sp. DT100]|uniref:hypothetical protein n=1 Tax=Tsukamurella sp. DT100 TaxID=3393415 RepID=UPI003CE991D5
MENATTTMHITPPTSCSYNDRAVYHLLLEIAAHDIEATALELHPADAYTISRGERRAAVWPTEAGDALEWELLSLPARGRWKVIEEGVGNESDMRAAVIDHLRDAQL